MIELTSLMRRLTKRQKTLLYLKIITSIFLFWTVGSMIIGPGVSLYLWCATMIMSTTTVIYGIHTWISDTGEEEG